jgi:hypothetical protein
MPQSGFAASDGPADGGAVGVLTGTGVGDAVAGGVLATGSQAAEVRTSIASEGATK